MSDKEPDYDDQQKYIKLRVMGKQGQRLLPDEHKFIVDTYEKYPDWTASQQGRIFDESKPFGA